MIMITVTILALVLVYKSFCNTVCIYMVMQIKLVVVVVGALPRGTNMAAVKQQKHLSLSFAIETKTYYSRVLTH